MLTLTMLACWTLCQVTATFSPQCLQRSSYTEIQKCISAYNIFSSLHTAPLQDLAVTLRLTLVSCWGPLHAAPDFYCRPRSLTLSLLYAP